MVANTVTMFPDSLFLNLEEVTLATVNPSLCLQTNFILPYFGGTASYRVKNLCIWFYS